jgi:hypothetical protein
MRGKVKVKVTLLLAISQSWCRALMGFMTRYSFPFDGGAPSRTRGRVCLLSVTVSSIKSIVKMSLYSHFTCHTCFMGARGSVVDKALCYKPEGREFDIR